MRKGIEGIDRAQGVRSSERGSIVRKGIDLRKGFDRAKAIDGVGL